MALRERKNMDLFDFFSRKAEKEKEDQLSGNDSNSEGGEHIPNDRWQQQSNVCLTKEIK